MSFAGSPPDLGVAATPAAVGVVAVGAVVAICFGCGGAVVLVEGPVGSPVGKPG